MPQENLLTNKNHIKREKPLYNLEYIENGIKVKTILHNVLQCEAKATKISIERKAKYYKDGLLLIRRVTGITRQHHYFYNSLSMFDKFFKINKYAVRPNYYRTVAAKAA